MIPVKGRTMQLAGAKVTKVNETRRLRSAGGAQSPQPVITVGTATPY